MIKNNQYTVYSFYQFTEISDPQNLCLVLKEFCKAKKIKGTILLANEGINAMLSGSTQDLEDLQNNLLPQYQIRNLDVKISHVDFLPFWRLKISVKKEIISFGLSLQKKDSRGIYVNAQKWNELIQQKDILVLDTRNDYEILVGRFNQALNPNLKTFKEFSDYVKNNLVNKENDPQKQKSPQKIAMYCTGGIRCEKASAYMLKLGFNEVYQLEGGILRYLEDIPQEENQFDGECFVFDRRVALKKDLQIGDFELCFGCKQPITKKSKELFGYEAGVSCANCFDKTTDSQKQRARERHRQVQLAKQKGFNHIGSRS